MSCPQPSLTVSSKGNASLCAMATKKRRVTKASAERIQRDIQATHERWQQEQREEELKWINQHLKDNPHFIVSVKAFIQRGCELASEDKFPRDVKPAWPFYEGGL